MTTRFRSKSGGDILMLDAHAQSFQKLLGREPARQGILQPPQMADALAAIDTAIAADERRRQADPGQPGDDLADSEAGSGSAGADRLPLRRRLWPMRELIRASQAEGEPIVWGV